MLLSDLKSNKVLYDDKNVKGILLFLIFSLENSTQIQKVV